MRRPFLAGNWKMNHGPSEARGVARELVRLVKDVNDRDIAIAPPFVSIPAVAEVVRGTNVALGAQDMFWEEKGAFTSAISPAMLLELGVEYVIIGHSERRKYFGETDATVQRKVWAALRHGLKPIVCVGETLEERRAKETMRVVERQVLAALAGIPKEDIEKVTIAYEPVWAIGTGVPATPEDAQEVIRFIRGLLAFKYGREAAERIRILYGGSVSPDNISDFMRKEDIDGALVGGASLKPDKFAAIVKYKV